MLLCHRLLLDCLGVCAANAGADFLRSSGGLLVATVDAKVRCVGFLFGGGGLGGRGRRGVTVGGSSIYVYSCSLSKTLPNDTEASSFFTAYGWTNVGCLAGVVYIQNKSAHTITVTSLYGCVHVQGHPQINWRGQRYE